MIILPDRNIVRTNFLVSVPKYQWRTPSQARPKDVFGRENTTRFRLTAKLNDGHPIWRGWFDDRSDFDAFLWSIATDTLRYEPELWDLPVGTWMPGHGYGNVGWRPDLGEELSYDFLSQTFLVSPTGSNQTYTSPADWYNPVNTIETIGAGASGGAAISTGGAAYRGASGGGGGAWNKTTNLSFATPGTTTATYQVGTGGVAATATGTGTTNGNNGGDTWFNGATLGAASVGSKAGLAGSGSGAANVSGGLGGTGASGIGSSSNNGGRGGDYTGGVVTAAVGTGGGGAAGSSGAGGAGVDQAAGASAATNGGAGDAGSGGAGGTSGNGGNGAEWDATHGSGGGGKGHSSTSTAGTAGSGGNYGGGGAGAGAIGAASGTETSGAGISGIIYISYQPKTHGFNLPMLGM